MCEVSLFHASYDEKQATECICFRTPNLHVFLLFALGPNPYRNSGASDLQIVYAGISASV